MANQKTNIEANKKINELKNSNREKRIVIKEKLSTLSPNTVIDRYILQDGKLIRLRKDKYKKMLQDKVINIIESKLKDENIPKTVI